MTRPALSLIAAVLLLPGIAGAASFDCRQARAPDERAICADASLGNLDSRLAGLLDLDEGSVAMGQRGEMQDAQTAWLKLRAACRADRACLRTRYETRLREVDQHLVLRLCGKDGPPC